MPFEYKRSRREQNLQAGEPVDNDISFSEFMKYKGKWKDYYGVYKEKYSS